MESEHLISSEPRDSHVPGRMHSGFPAESQATPQHAYMPEEISLIPDIASKDSTHPENDSSSVGRKDLVQTDDNDNDNEVHQDSTQEAIDKNEDDDRSRLRDEKIGDRPVEIPTQPWTRLHRSGYLLLLVISYAALVLFAWIVTCVVTYRPIASDMKHYS